MDEMVLEKLYQEKLEERIIAYLAEKYGISFEEAMEAYYNSKVWKVYSIWIIRCLHRFWKRLSLIF